MAQIYAGSFGSGTSPENSLNTALLQYPEIARTLIKQYPRYSATYLLERTGRYAKEKVLGDNSFEWKVMGRYNTPSYNLGWASLNGTTFVAENGASGTGATDADADLVLNNMDADGDQFYLSVDGADAN